MAKCSLILALALLVTVTVSAQRKGSVTVDVNKNGNSKPSATVGVQYPIVDKKNTQLNVGGSSTFQKGSKPNHQVGITFSHKFK